MLLYLNSRGRDALQLVALWVVLLLVVGSVAPSIALAVPAAGAPPSADGVSPAKQTTGQSTTDGGTSQGSAKKTNGSSSGTKNGSPKSADARPSNAKTGQPAKSDTLRDTSTTVPDLSDRVAASTVAGKAFTPWIQDDVPWDGNWGAFNKTTSERTGGTCALNKQSATRLENLKRGLSADWEKIEKKHKSESKREQAWRETYTKRLSEGKGTQGADGKYDNKGGFSRATLEKAGVKSHKGYPQWVNMVNSSKEFASCDGDTTGILDVIFSKALPNPLTLLSNAPLFIVQCVFLPITLVFGPIYALLSPFAPAMAMNTPHSERGDTFINSFSLNRADAASSMQIEACSKGQDVDANLGFSCENLKSDEQGAVWIKLAQSLRGVLSIAYGVIVVAVALIYLVRHNSQSQLNIKTVLPRVFLATLLSAIGPYLIGMGITFSNWTVAALLTARPGSVSSQITESITALSRLEVGGVSGVIRSIIGAVMSYVLICIFAVVFIGLFLIGIIKQFLLIALIVTLPVACLAFVMKGSQGSIVQKWLKAYVAVIGIPIVLASILTLGLTLSNSLYDSSTANGVLEGIGIGSSVVSAFLLAATGIGMIVAVKKIQVFSAVAGSTFGALGSVAAVGGTVAGAATGNVALAHAGRSVGNSLKTGTGSRWSGNDQKSLPGQAASKLLSPASRRLSSLEKAKSDTRRADDQDEILRVRASQGDTRAQGILEQRQRRLDAEARRGNAPETGGKKPKAPPAHSSTSGPSGGTGGGGGGGTPGRAPSVPFSSPVVHRDPDSSRSESGTTHHDSHSSDPRSRPDSSANGSTGSVKYSVLGDYRRGMSKALSNVRGGYDRMREVRSTLIDKSGSVAGGVSGLVSGTSVRAGAAEGRRQAREVREGAVERARAMRQAGQAYSRRIMKITKS